MRLSTRGRYALRAMIEVARHEHEDRPTSLAAVSDETGISRGYLDQVAQLLRNARLLRGVSGRHGGYRLARPAADIDLAEILQAAIGPICIVECVDTPEICNRSSTCETRLIYALVNHSIVEKLHSYALTDLIDPGRLAEMRQQVEKLPALFDRKADRSKRLARRGNVGCPTK